MTPTSGPPTNSDPFLDSVVDTADQLIRHLAGLESVVVAFSGGVDSAVVAAAAYQALSEKAVAATAAGPALGKREKLDAQRVADQIGIKLQFIDAAEIKDPNYRMNDANRCFHCKSALYQNLRRFADANSIAHIANGTNADDFSDYRPGLRAASDHSVEQPLADLKINKTTVRRLAAHFNLPVANKPAAPCLASRVEYGVAVSEKWLKAIDAAERKLHEIGYHDVRVRLHSGEIARIELPLKQIEAFFAEGHHLTINRYLKEIGFRFVSLDLGGRQSGALNQMLPILDSDQ